MNVFIALVIVALVDVKTFTAFGTNCLIIHGENPNSMFFIFCWITNDLFNSLEPFCFTSF